MGTAYTRAKAAEALSNAKAEIARRGLAVTVTKNYYGLVVAQRKYATAQAGLDQAKHFLDITQDLEHQGQAPHSDAVKAEIQYRIQKQAFDEAKFSMEDTRLGLAVILFPDFNENFTVVDDLDSAPALPPFPEVQEMAEKQNPDMRVALETLREADLDVKLAKTAFLPTLTVDTDYGIEANCFALHCTRASLQTDPAVGVVPNLGYFLTAALTVPVWDWGTLRSKLHQAEYKQDSAKAALSLAKRMDISELYATYDEAIVARAALEESRSTAELAAESLRLTNLRYQGGAAPASDVVDAETALVTARNAYADAQVRYRTLLATSADIYGKFLSNRKHNGNERNWSKSMQFHSMNQTETGRMARAFGSLAGGGDFILRLRGQGRSRSIAHRDRAGGRRGKRADPAQGGDGRGAVPARSSGHRAEGRLVH